MLNETTLLTAINDTVNTANSTFNASNSTFYEGLSRHLLSMSFMATGMLIARHGSASENESTATKIGEMVGGCVLATYGIFLEVDVWEQVLVYVACIARDCSENN